MCKSVCSLRVLGQSGDSEEDQSVAVGPGQRGGHRKPLRPPAQRDPRQELRQLLRLLREVGAAGASAPPVQGERAEQKVQSVLLIGSSLIPNGIFILSPEK